MEPLARLEKHSTSKIDQLAGEPETRIVWKIILANFPALVIDDDVLVLDVSVEDAPGVEEVHCRHNLP